MQYFTKNIALLPEFHSFQWSTLSTNRIPNINTNHYTIDRDCNSLFEEGMREPHSWHRPKKHSWYNIRLISALKFWYNQKDRTQSKYRIIEISRSSESKSKISEPHRDIECGSHDDPPKSDIDTRSNIHIRITSTREGICKKSEDCEHHEECCPDPDIPPWEEPYCSEPYSEREGDERSIVDLLFSFLKKCDIYSCDDPREIDERPYPEGHTRRCDGSRELIRDICLCHPSYQIGWTWYAKKWSDTDGQYRCYKKEIFFHRKK